MKLPSFLVLVATFSSKISENGSLVLAFAPNSNIHLSTYHHALSTYTTSNNHNNNNPPFHQTNIHMSSSSSNEGEPPSQKSRLGGNFREPTIQELSIMDDMITKLINAKPYELPNAVSKAIRVVSSPRFFMRIAERADIATDEVEKAKLSTLAENLVSTIEVVVSTAEDRLEDKAKLVEKVVKAASEPESGEFLVPLSVERLDAMRTTIASIDASELDEGFLSTVDAWMNKSSQDGLDGMVGILQKVLQIYAGNAILQAKTELQINVGAALSGESQAKADEKVAQQKADESEPKPATVLLDQLLSMDTDNWDFAMRKAFSAKDDGEDGGESRVTPKALTGETQRIIEAVVLGLESGSMAQRVQAEYLKELVTRIETVEKQL